MKRFKSIIVLLVSFGLLSSAIPSVEVSNLTKWACGIDTLKPWLIVYKDNVDGHMVSYWVKGGGGQTPSNEGAPVVLVGDDRDIPADQSIITLDGSSSYSPSGSALTYLWEKISGTGGTITTPTSASTTVSGLVAGNVYKFRLTVTDANNLSSNKVLTITVSALASAQFYIVDSSLFNLTPYNQSVSGWTNLTGQPGSNVLTATSNGITLSTVGTDTTLWRGDKSHSNTVALLAGMPFTTPGDPFGFTFPKEVLRSGFVNAASQYVPGTYNLELTGLDDNSMYQIQLAGSFYDSVNNAPNTLAHNMYVVCKSANMNNLKTISSTVYNTSRIAVFDTVKPDNGTVYLSVTGMDSTYTGDGGTKSIVSAVKVYKISKTEEASGITYMHRTYYDTVLMINDGVKTRPVIVYKPYNYNPEKSYGLIYYQAGDESKILNDNWDTQFMTNFGLAFTAEKMEGKMYGLSASGDTVSFVIIQPQLTLGESLSSAQINTIITAVKSKSLYNISNDLYIAGFSSGAVDIDNYIFDYSWKLRAAYVQSPFGSPTNITDSAAKVVSNHVHVWVTTRSDGFSTYSTNILNVLPDSLKHERIWTISHRGFEWEYLPDNRKLDPKYNQSMLDFFANPYYTQGKIAYFSFRMQTANQVPDYYTNVVGDPNYQNPTQAVLTATDAGTGWTISTVATNKWSWSIPTRRTYTAERIYPFYVNQYVLNSSGLFNTKDGGYATNGADLQLSGLTPSTDYEVWVMGNTEEGVSNITTYSTPTDSKDYDNSAPYDQLNWIKLTGTSDASGNLGIGVYGKTNDDTGVITAMIVKEIQ